MSATPITVTMVTHKAVTLTHVRYLKGDRLGYFLAWVSLVPVFISLGGFISHFLFRRELQAMFFALGLIVSQFLNELIKTSVHQSRPETCAALEMCESHGGPSSHSQYMFFFAIYYTFLSFKGIGFTGKSFLGLLVPWPLAVLTMYSRVYLGYDTVAQVFAGTALGLVLGALWFWAVNSVLVHYFPTIEDSSFEHVKAEADNREISGAAELNMHHGSKERVVSSVELEKKLHHLLTQQQERQIIELQTQLHSIHAMLRTTCTQLQSLKNHVRCRLTEFSLQTASDGEDGHKENMEEQEDNGGAANSESFPIDVGQMIKMPFVGTKRALEIGSCHHCHVGDGVSGFS